MQVSLLGFTVTLNDKYGGFHKEDICLGIWCGLWLNISLCPMILIKHQYIGELFRNQYFGFTKKES